MKPIVVSGFKPSGKLHIGNYLGAIKQGIALQENEKHECFYFIADYHALTQKYDPKKKSEEITGMIIDLLALGLDPKKSVFFIQSDILEHANLAWLLNTVIPAGQLQNMIEFKEKVQEGQPASAGLLNYPILMAADILSYKASLVPVGEDQRQHLELARDAARNFNKSFGELFPEPKAIYVEGLRIKSLDNPEKKMSKSLPKGCLYLEDEPEIIRKKIKTAVTDSGTNIVYDPETKPALSNLLLIQSELTNTPIKELVKRFENSTYSEYKETLAEDLIASLSPFRERRKEFSKDFASIRKMMTEGAESARAIASNTLSEAKKMMGLV